jgi:hypothetical protein
LTHFSPGIDKCTPSTPASQHPGDIILKGPLFNKS